MSPGHSSCRPVVTRAGSSAALRSGVGVGVTPAEPRGPPLEIGPKTVRARVLQAPSTPGSRSTVPAARIGSHHRGGPGVGQPPQGHRDRPGQPRHRRARAAALCHQDQRHPLAGNHLRGLGAVADRFEFTATWSRRSHGCSHDPRRICSAAARPRPGFSLAGQAGIVVIGAPGAAERPCAMLLIAIAVINFRVQAVAPGTVGGRRGWPSQGRPGGGGPG